MAARTALWLTFAVSLITSGFVLSAKASERKTAIITFDVPAATHGAFQGTHGNAISPQGTITGFFDSNDCPRARIRFLKTRFINGQTSFVKYLLVNGAKLGNHQGQVV